MKFAIITITGCFVSTRAFVPSGHLLRRTSPIYLAKDPNFDLSGNTWKPTEGRMHSTDTGDYLPEGYVEDIDFTEGMLGSQAGLGAQKQEPQLPGMEHLGEDAIMMGGIEVADGIPEGMEFIPSSVPDGELEYSVPASSTGQIFPLEIKPFCMGYEDFYAAFSPDSHQSFTVSPATGRMDRRGGESTWLTITCNPKGQAGTFEGNLVVNLPDDDSKLSYKVTASVF